MKASKSQTLLKNLFTTLIYKVIKFVTLLQVTLIISLILFISIGSCKQVGKDFKKNLFADGIDGYSGLKLFSLLDNYPALKNAMQKLKPEDFNLKLDQSLKLSKESLPNGLRSISNLLLNKENKLRSLLARLSNLLNQIRTNNPAAFGQALVLIEKIRASQSQFLAPLIPIDNLGLNHLLATKSNEELRKAILDLSNNLSKQSTKDLLVKLENFLYKALGQNQNTKSALATLVSAIADESLIEDRTFKNKLLETLGGIGNMFQFNSGVFPVKSPERVIKELIINLDEYFTVGGNIYQSTPEYQTTGYSYELGEVLTQLYIRVRRLINTPSALIKDNQSPILSLLSESYHSLGFTANFPGVDFSLGKMIAIDAQGRNRAFNLFSDSINSLDSLLFTLSLVDAYGYKWNNNQNAPQITEMTGGVITLGDALHSLSSKMEATDTDSLANLGLVAVLNKSAYEAVNNGKVKRNGINYPVDMNTPALALLEGESRGPLPYRTSFSQEFDPIYTKTIPWVLGTIVETLFSGKAPYYNKNRKDSSGNILTFDGKIYKNSAGNDLIYKSSWQTGKYRIAIRNNKYVGLGGVEVGASDEGTSFTIHEFNIPESSRALESDEEAFYKNFQWLLYEKRIVIVIPVLTEALGGGIQDATYATIIGNGLKGLMNLKPYCELTCKEQDNGIWLKAKVRIKTDFKTIGDLQNFSQEPGDSVFFLETWGYGLSNPGYGFTDDTVFQQVFRLLFANFSDPSRFYGPIPAPIKWNFAVIERLGFWNDVEVSSSLVNQYWDNRNQLLPLIASLARSFYLQTDSINNKNPYFLLTDLAKVIMRPYIYEGLDPVALNSSPPAAVNIINFRIRGAGGSFGIRSPRMPSAALYYPVSNLRTLISILSENSIRFQDGLLPILGKSNTLSNLGEAIYALGEPSKKTLRAKLHDGLSKFLDQVKTNAENPSSIQFNIETAINELVAEIAIYQNSRSSNLDDSTWSSIDDIVDLLRNFVSTSSPYNYTDNLSRLLDSIIEAKPSQNEISAVFDLIVSILINPTTNQQSYLLTDILTTDISKFLPNLADDPRDLLIIAESLTKPSTFLDYFLDNARSDYPFEYLIIDLEKFLVSPEIHSLNEDKNSLFYNTSMLCLQFANIIQLGKKPQNMPFWFADHENITNEKSTLFDRLNFLLSKK